MEKLVFDICIPLDGPDNRFHVLCTCESVDAVVAIVRSLIGHGVKGPSRIGIEQRRIAE